MADENTVTYSKEDATTLARGLQLLQAMNGNAEARPLLEKAIQHVVPGVKTSTEQAAELLKPQMDEIAALRETLKADIEQRKADAQAAAEQSAQTRMEEGFALLRRNDGLTTEGETAVKQLMLDRNIADPTAAFLLFQRENPAPVTPNAAAYSPQTFDYAKNTADNDVEGLWKDPDQWLEGQIGRILADERKQPSFA